MMIWNVDNPASDTSLLGMLNPDHVLVEYNGPRIFTFHSNGRLLLAYHCDEDDDSWRYTVVPFSAMLLHALAVGALTIVEALTQPWAWIIDVDNSGSVYNAWAVDPISIPSSYRPGPEVRLVDRQHDDFSVRMLARTNDENGVALSVIRTAADRTSTALRKLVDYVGTKNELGGYSAQESRRQSDFMVPYVLVASFEISIELREPAKLTKSSDTDTDRLFAAEIRRLLERVIEWSANPELMDAPDEGDPSEAVAILQAMEDLTPSGRTDVGEVQLGGKLVSRVVGQRVSLRKELRPKLREAIKRRVESGRLTGWVEHWPKLISVNGKVGYLQTDGEPRWLLLTEIGSVSYLDSRQLFEEGEWQYGERILFTYDPAQWMDRILEAVRSQHKVTAIGSLILEPIGDDALSWPKTSPVYRLLDLKLL